MQIGRRLLTELDWPQHTSAWLTLAPLIKRICDAITYFPSLRIARTDLCIYLSSTTIPFPRPPGRSWSAEELRQKSFKDLHTLWYILLRERNVLATQREERSRLGITLGNDLLSKRTFRCRKSMARIKYVLNERRLALLAAAESTRPTDSPKVKVPGKSPLGAADPLSLSGFEKSEDRVQWYRGHGEALGDGERQKEDQLEEKPVAVPEEDVSKEEVEARDEGFGSGKEAKEFVKEMEKKE